MEGGGGRRREEEGERRREEEGGGGRGRRREGEEEDCEGDYKVNYLYSIAFTHHDIIIGTVWTVLYLYVLECDLDSLVRVHSYGPGIVSCVGVVSRVVRRGQLTSIASKITTIYYTNKRIQDFNEYGTNV